MRIFADRHHDGLAYSLRLMAKRLGAEIYFPIGERWFDEGFWDIAKPYNNNPDTIKQYLQIKPEHKPADGSPVLNSIVGRTYEHYEVEDKYHGDTLKAITFQQFLEMEIDVIIGSIPDHWHTYKRLRDEHKPRAKVVAQMGNMFNELYHCIADGTVQNLLASTIEIPFAGYPLNTVFYHQEQPIGEFRTTTLPSISSYVHLLPQAELYQLYKEVLPEFEWKAYGASTPDGWQPTLSHLYESMRHSSLIWQVKPRGDGYGWNWHSAYMMGRPVITNFSDYKDKLGGALFEDLVTGINLEARSMSDNAAIIRNLVTTGEIVEMQEKCRSRFFEVVDYDKEEQKLREFFENLR